MRTERRRKLEENVLANWLASVLVKIQPYQNAILGAVLFVVIVVVVYSWASRRSVAVAEAAWNELFESMNLAQEDPARLEQTAEKFAGTETGQWAALLAGELYLNKGSDLLFQNKTEAREYLNRARELFQRLLDQARSEVIRERATFDLARTHETAGELDEAVQSWSSPSAKQAGQKPDRGYQGVLNLWPEGTYASAAKARLEDLQRHSTRKFYDDFVRWEPRPLPPEVPGGSPQSKALPELTLPEGPVFMPKIDSSGGSAREKTAPDMSGGLLPTKPTPKTP